jgi:hypothetical protein
MFLGFYIDGAWYHRLWIVNHFHINFDEELALCKEFLKADQRNFHCWNYRRALHQRSGTTYESEMAYSTEKIYENFSNYSAFHHRSAYLPTLIDDSVKSGSSSLEEIIEAELSLVENAIFTEPDDQSAWWYQQYLCTFTMKRISTAAQQENYSQADLTEWMTNLFLKQMTISESLLEIEHSSRWAMNSIVFLIDCLLSVEARKNKRERGMLTEKEALKELRKRMLTNLSEIDPIHINRYKYLLGKVL